MRMEGTIYCDGPGCERSAHLGVDTMARGRLAIGNLRVIEYGHSSDPELAFCGWDCCLRYAGTREPEQIIPMFEEDSDAT